MVVKAHGYEWYCPRCGGRRSYLRPPRRLVANLARVCRLTLVGRRLGKILYKEALSCTRCHMPMAVRACPIRRRPAANRLLLR